MGSCESVGGYCSYEEMREISIETLVMRTNLRRAPVKAPDDPDAVD